MRKASDVQNKLSPSFACEQSALNYKIVEEKLQLGIQAFLLNLLPKDQMPMSHFSPGQQQIPISSGSVLRRMRPAGVTLVRATRCLCLNIMLPRIKKKESNICCAVGYTLEFGEAWRIPGIKEEESRRRRRTRNLVG
nr:hypothetical protein Iba_chr12fCG10510 [Ipomoea batatas]